MQLMKQQLLPSHVTCLLLVVATAVSSEQCLRIPLDNCVRSGCSRELCGSAVQVSTCIFNPRNTCLDTLAECRMDSDGTCQWNYVADYETKCDALVGGQ